MELDSPNFLIADVVACSGIDPNTLQTWIRRQMFLFDPQDRSGAGTGSRRLFTRRTICRSAIAAELVRNGVAPGRAFNAARLFTNVPHADEHGGVSFAFGDSHLKGRIFLILYPSQNQGVDQDASIYEQGSGPCTLILPDQSDRLAEVLARGGCSSAICVDCTAIVADVDRVLEARQ